MTTVKKSAARSRGAVSQAAARQAGPRKSAAKKPAAKAIKGAATLARKVSAARRREVKSTLDSGHELTNQLIDTNRAIWLAGLGAFAKARDAVGARGGHMFDSLVKAGQEIEARARGVIDSGSDRLKGTVDQVAGYVDKNVTHLENMVDSRIEKVLEKLGVPAGESFSELVDKVRELTEQVETLVGRRAE